MLWKGKQFLLHMRHPSCYTCYKRGDMSWMRKWSNCDFEKRNISMVICDMWHVSIFVSIVICFKYFIIFMCTVLELTRFYYHLKDILEQMLQWNMNCLPFYGSWVHSRFLVGFMLLDLYCFPCFVDRCLSFPPFSFCHCVVCPSLIYRCWLDIWDLQTLLTDFHESLPL